MSDEDELESSPRPIFSAKWLYIFAGLIALLTFFTVALFFGSIFVQIPKLRPMPAPTLVQ